MRTAIDPLGYPLNSFSVPFSLLGCTIDVPWTLLGRTLPLFYIYQKNNSYYNYSLQVFNDYEDNYELLIVN